MFICPFVIVWNTIYTLLFSTNTGSDDVKNDKYIENIASSKDDGGHISTYDGKRTVINVNDIDIKVDGLVDGLLDGYDGLLKRDRGIC